MTPEFHRPLVIGRIGSGGRRENLVASEAERAALAERFGIPAIGLLRAELLLHPAPGGAIAAAGRLVAEVVQSCIVTLEPVEQSLDLPLALRFIPEGAEPSEDPEAPDEFDIDGETIDLGEAVAEQLSLALDPYPRAPGATLPEGLVAPPEPEAAVAPPRPSPFAALTRLKRDK
ncbi:DUF177 domain-containing protein [Roseomonas hellenica]|uniref:DUF177 domain-containing protein n=1 Tax=Plastoroseomonas hellenica TaxID=2687306 RepID=A0ABS5EZH7_9PROT|nr:DUF177 domain-containing protein [Plastoroseomonas hellenica]MBR0665717.1 DUF177 domain-containing protein [Plastoroseomonas hellenica]